MKVGDRIVVTALWSSFHTMKGAIVSMSPHLMVLIDHDMRPIRMGEREVALEESSSVSLTGAE